MNEKFEEAVKGLYPGSYNDKVRKWLNDRYGEEKAKAIWTDVQENYLNYLEGLPDYGGKKNGHASAIYGGLLIFSLYPALPDQPPVGELQNFVQEMFMGPFTKLGKIFNLNRRRDMWLIDKVFQFSGNRDRKDFLKYPEGFVNVSEPFDKEHCASRDHFTQCPNAEFAKRHHMEDVLPLMCNCDHLAMRKLHATLIREGTCCVGDVCDYCIVGDRNPLAAQYALVTRENGLWVSVRK